MVTAAFLFPRPHVTETWLVPGLCHGAGTHYMLGDRLGLEETTLIKSEIVAFLNRCILILCKKDLF